VILVVTPRSVHHAKTREREVPAAARPGSGGLERGEGTAAAVIAEAPRRAGNGRSATPTER
jgi:hypothetical protein